ncbi:MAG TPA: SGNH/GDSL hydrolase family protein, partial [Polyangia bacterium]|nr:SGNH/GDSL hydrolase family protein [Polyangia bacterium]
PASTGNGGTIGSGGTVATGGTTSSGGNASGGTVGAGGTVGSGGSVGTGGTPATGGTIGSGGTTASGGATGSAGHAGHAGSTGGTGGSGTGSAGSGATGSGGAGGRGTGGSASGGTTGAGGASSGSCQKGQTKGSDVAILGESFYAISPQYIQNRIQDDARKAGSLGASDTYHNVAVSGQNMNYIATTEWTAATQGGAAPKWVIMDGGGIDCLSGGSTCSTCASTFKTLLGKMGTAGVKEVIYTRYPEPGNPPGSNTSLKACLDSTMPGMQTTCEGSTSPKCHFVDLRPVWVNGDTTDGLHPTQSGGDHVGDLIWSEMVKECFAQ